MFLLLHLLVPLLFIIPAHYKSLHPGTDSKPFEALYTQAAEFRKISIPAMIGWILLGVWIFDLRYRTKKLVRTQNFVCMNMKIIQTIYCRF
jgi:heme exporter protein C